MQIKKVQSGPQFPGCRVDLYSEFVAPLVVQISHRLLKASFQLLFVSIFSLHVFKNFFDVTVYNNTCVRV